MKKTFTINLESEEVDLFRERNANFSNAIESLIRVDNDRVRHAEEKHEETEFEKNRRVSEEKFIAKQNKQIEEQLNVLQKEYVVALDGNDPEKAKKVRAEMRRLTGIHPEKDLL